MVSQTNEQALEAAIEKHLTGVTTEALKAGKVRETAESYAATNNGFHIGLPEYFDKQYAFDTHFFWQFLETSQEQELAKLKKYNPNDWQRKILERYDRLIKKHGILHLLKKGLSVDNAHFHLLYPAPLASSSEKIHQQFESNIFSSTRQLQYSKANPLQEIDMVLFLNGIPLVTLELKNAWTGQTARYHGKKQYCNDRDTSQPLLNFARCLVHMAVDTDEVYMMTKLAGKGTFFLPFNKGHLHGQGNPPNPNGHKTAYLWEEVFTKLSLVNIIQHFMRLDGSRKDPLHKRTLFFPRYHQMDVVRKLLDHAADNGVGHTYLIQHSAGSGKSNSITWAAYQLIEVYPKVGFDSISASLKTSAQPAKIGRSVYIERSRNEAEKPLFDSVIVVTDRRLLDKQLRDNIKEFSEVKNIVTPAFRSADLKTALESGKKIIITTIQKFPFIIDGISDLSDKRFAVIIDEAHSSQSGSAHDNMNRAMGASEVGLRLRSASEGESSPDLRSASEGESFPERSRREGEVDDAARLRLRSANGEESSSELRLRSASENELSPDLCSANEGESFPERSRREEHIEDTQDKILKAMQSRKIRNNASYFAFTATPKSTTLEKFGIKQADGSFQPFHLYSMNQAIQEGFILDVLANYTTYRSYYEIEKSIRDNPKFDTAKAQKKLRAYVERSQQTINTKAEIMLEHFIPNVINAKKLRGKGKGMVVTQNIEAAIRYYKAITRLLDAQNNPFKVAIAFSGTKEVDGLEYTEAGMNGFAESDTKDKFDTDEYRLLVVANKYLTGFDQPKLCSMYIDKKLSDVLCVQALSRLNRSAPKWGKKTEDLFILDFFNSVEDIKAAFDPFYTATTLSEATDINVLNDLKDALDDVGVYEHHEVETFVTYYFNNKDFESLSPIVDEAADRFNHTLELIHADKADFKIKAKQFVKIYGQIAAILPYEMLEWEKLFWFLKFLIPKLIVKDPDSDKLDELLESVDLSSYGLERVKLNYMIQLDDEESELKPPNPNPRGAHGGDTEYDPLDEIIRTFNERWFQGWGATAEEKKVKFVLIKENMEKHPDFEAKYQNNIDPHTRDLAFEKILKEIMLKRRKEELELYKLYAGDPSFKTSLIHNLQEAMNRDLS